MSSSCCLGPSLLKESHSHHRVGVSLRKLLAVCTTALPLRRKKLTQSSEPGVLSLLQQGTILGIELCYRQATSHIPPLSLIYHVVQLSFFSHTSEGSDVSMSKIADKCHQLKCPPVDEWMNNMWCTWYLIPTKKKILPYVMP